MEPTLQEAIVDTLEAADDMNVIVIGVVVLLAISTPPSLSSAQTPADAIVRQLRDLPTPLHAIARSDGSIDPVEQLRHELYRDRKSVV